jgi:RimJ/RimL family protein N-acetyltransferase
MTWTTPLGDPIGDPLPDWRPPPRPPHEALEGRYARLEPLTAGHAEELHAANSRDAEGRMWTYMPNGPYASLADYRAWVEGAAKSADPQFYAIRDLASGRATGTASYLRIAPEMGSIEIGFIAYSPALQRTRAGTEAMYLFMRNAFDLGYRRYEWKCNALNAASRRLAMRLGLSYEGVFRQMMVVKGRNRDTAWYAAIDKDWPAIRAAFEAWLDPANFDAEGRQRQSLSALTRPVLVNIG